MGSRIFCLMFSGKSLTDKISEVLFINAHDMVEEGTTKRRVKGRDYDGVITSDLQAIAAFGTTGVVFSAQIGTTQGDTDVQYLVRVGDLDQPIEAYKLEFIDITKKVNNRR